MIALTSLQSIHFFNVTECNNKFDIYTDFVNEFSFEKLKDELEEILVSSDISTEHLQEKKLGPRNIKAYIKLSSGKR